MRSLKVAISADLQLVTEECCRCGVLFAVSMDLQQQWRKTRQSFYCPNGHQQSYTEHETDRLRRELEAAKRTAEWERQRAETAEKRRIKAEQSISRLRKRVNCGVCPHCQRTVRQMADHIRTKHPEVLAASSPAPQEPK